MAHLGPTRTDFESDPLFPERYQRRHGYCPDLWPDGVQSVLVLAATPEGLPMSYETMPGTIRDRQTLVLTRRTEPGLDQRVLLGRRGWELPENAPPRIAEDLGLETNAAAAAAAAFVS